MWVQSSLKIIKVLDFATDMSIQNITFCKHILNYFNKKVEFSYESPMNIVMYVSFFNHRYEMLLTLCTIVSTSTGN